MMRREVRSRGDAAGVIRAESGLSSLKDISNDLAFPLARVTLAWDKETDPELRRELRTARAELLRVRVRLLELGGLLP